MEFLLKISGTGKIFDFSKIVSGPRTGPKKNPPRYGFFRTKIRTTYRTRFESGPKSGPRTGPNKIRTENPDHGPDQLISYQKSGPRTKIRTGPDFRYGPAIHGHIPRTGIALQDWSTIITLFFSKKCQDCHFSYPVK